MTISKIDLLNKKFNRCMRGYCPDEVDLLLHDVAEALGQAADENRRLAERLVQLDRNQPVKLHEPNAYLPPTDLRGAMAAGRKIVDEINENARQEALRIIDEARVDGARLVSEANMLKARVLEEIADLRAQREGMEQDMRQLLEKHFRLLESYEGSAARNKPGGDFVFAEGQE